MWIVLCAAGGFERDAVRAINKHGGAATVPMQYVEISMAYGGKRKIPKAIMPGYVFATWLHEPPFAALRDIKTPRGNTLIWGALTHAGGGLAYVTQSEIDALEAMAAATAGVSGGPGYRRGDMVRQRLGNASGAEIIARVTDIVGNLLSLETTMLGRVVAFQRTIDQVEAA